MCSLWDYSDYNGQNLCRKKGLPFWQGLYFTIPFSGKTFLKYLSIFRVYIIYFKFTLSTNP